MNDEPFNPLAMDSLAESVVRKLMQTTPVPLQGIPRFYGAGVYAIYYTGDFPAYRVVKRENQDGRWGLPIYVGKAVPKGGRQGLNSGQASTNTALWSRLREHAKSIEAVTNLNIEDFMVRWIVVDEIWIPLGESTLIRSARPVWNAAVDGFGNHDPGRGRYKGSVPQWDTLHPGRPWAERLAPREPGEDRRIAAYAAKYLEERHC
ncbi:MAG: Eco29kI family restriction endonuclease [Buchananella hordeovulneris]|nr:Eco29kI family restriction endonuclease [Buchananella hordeovulneris]